MTRGLLAPTLLTLALGSGCAKVTFDHTLTTTAPRATLWEVWTDVPNWPDWDTEMSRASLDGAFAEGATGSVDTPDGTVPIVISRVDEGQGYTLTFELVGGTLNIDRDAVDLDDTPEDGGVEFTHRFRFEGLTAQVYAEARSSYYEGILPGVMELLRDIVEDRAATGD